MATRPSEPGVPGDFPTISRRAAGPAESVGPTPSPSAAAQSSIPTAIPLLGPMMASQQAVDDPGIGPASDKNRRRPRPCDACRRRKSRCVLPPDRTVCVLCEFHRQECTFVESPRPRKRRAPAVGPVPLRVPVSVDSARPQPVAGPVVAGGGAVGPAGPSGSVSMDRPTRMIVGPTSTPEMAASVSARLVGTTGPADPIVLALAAPGGVRVVGPGVVFVLDPGLDERRAWAELDGVLAHGLGSVLAGVYFHSFDPVLPVVRGIDIAASVGLRAAVCQAAARRRGPASVAEALKRIANSALSAAWERPRLADVVAAVVMAVANGSDLPFEAIFAAERLGLHLDCRSWQVSDSEQAVRRRVAAAVIVVDTWAALVRGRTRMVRWKVDLTDCVEPGLFAELVKLTVIVSDILDLFETDPRSGSIGSGRLDAVLDAVKPVQLRLRHWHAALPAEARVESNPAAGSVQLAYFVAEMTLHRRILHALIHHQTRARTQSTSRSAEFGTESSECESESADDESECEVESNDGLATLCRAAARTRLISSLDFVNRLTGVHLQAPWLIPPAEAFGIVASFGALLGCTSATVEEASFYRARLAEFRWTVAVSRPHILAGLLGLGPGPTASIQPSTATSPFGSDEADAGVRCWVDDALAIVDQLRAMLERVICSPGPVVPGFGLGLSGPMGEVAGGVRSVDGAGPPGGTDRLGPRK